jgi:hypothetical protein
MLQSSFKRSSEAEANAEVEGPRISYRELCDLSASEFSEFNTAIASPFVSVKGRD